ncbi:hypothetical protein [Microtetraspora fusca]|nr:hypothetical protein [Microtetraspora fusca]
MSRRCAGAHGLAELHAEQVRGLAEAYDIDRAARRRRRRRSPFRQLTLA